MEGYDSLRRSSQLFELQSRSNAISTDIVVDTVASLRIGMKDHAHLQARERICVFDLLGQLQPVMRVNQIERFVILCGSPYRLRGLQSPGQFTQCLIFEQIAQ